MSKNIPNMTTLNGINLVKRNKNGNPVNNNNKPIIPNMSSLTSNERVRNNHGYALTETGKRLHSSIVRHYPLRTTTHPLKGSSYKRKYQKHKTKQTRRFRK